MSQLVTEGVAELASWLDRADAPTLQQANTSRQHSCHFIPLPATLCLCVYVVRTDHLLATCLLAWLVAGWLAG